MKMKRFSIFSFGLFLYCLYFLVTAISFAKQIPVKEKQVDVITLQEPYPKFIGKDNTVDVRKVARNLHNKEMYVKAFRVLVFADNTYFSSSAVNLLKTALNDNSVEVRRRAIVLLKYSRNPEAIPLLADRLQNDPSSRVRGLAAAILRASGRGSGGSFVKNCLD